MSLTEAGLLREVAVLQRDKTLLAVRDLVDNIPATAYDERAYKQKPRPATDYRDDLLRGLRALGESP